jgi:hypothetical protein
VTTPKTDPTTRDGVHGEIPDGDGSLTSSAMPAARLEHASDGADSRTGAASSTAQVGCAPGRAGSPAGAVPSAAQVGCAPDGIASPAGMATSTGQVGCAPGGPGSSAGVATSTPHVGCAPGGAGSPADVATSGPHVGCAPGEGRDTVGRRVGGPGSGAVSLGVVGGVALVVGVFLGVRGSGWVWPLLFLAGVVVVGVLVGRRPWLVVGMVVVTGALLSAPDGLVRYLGSLWLWVAALLGAAAVLGSVRRCVPAGATVLWHLALLLPRGERELWRAEVGSVLHACSSAAERRRQVRGFLGAVPATVLTSWRVRR